MCASFQWLSRLYDMIAGRFFAFLAASEAATLVVAHRPELARHHTHELAFDGHGGAAMREL